MRSLASDVRRAGRTMFKRPAVSALVILTLGLGLGANATIFGGIDALILRPFTIPDLDRLVMVAETEPGTSADTQETVSPANYLDWKAQTDAFEHLAAFGWWDVNLAGQEEAERVAGFFVTANFFPAVGVAPSLGRTFMTDEEVRGNHRRAVLSHALWQRRFGGDRDILGKTVLLDTEPFEIVGVMPEGFGFPLGADVWAPLALDPKAAMRRDDRYLSVVGRLSPGRTIDDAKAQIALVAQRLEQQYPVTNKDRGARVVTMVQGMRDQGLGPMLSLWQASACLVLLIACANIANLLLARGAERQRELAVRAALGASRSRIVRELLVESVVLACAAIPLALGVAWVGIRLIRINLPPRLVRFVDGWTSMGVDERVFGFTVLLALATAIVFGLLPALRASRPALNESLKEGGRSASAGRQRQRLRKGLVIAEIALALPLLVASGMSTLGAHRFLNGPQGYEPDGLLTMRAVLPDAKYLQPEARRRFTDDVVARLSVLPGVRSVGLSNVLPSSNNNSSRAIEVEAVPTSDPANPPLVDNRLVGPAFLGTMQIPVLQGRNFSDADRADSLPVAIISKSAAERHFPGADPIGRKIRLGTDPWLTVVGVSGDYIQQWFNRRNAPTVYRPYAQAPSAYLAIGVRADGDLAALIPAARAAVREVDPAQPIFDVMPMRQALAEKTIGLQYIAAIMAVFGLLALVLAVVGVYSLMAFVITQRTHEIGVRIALGAKRGDVIRLTVGQSARMTAAGAILGLMLSAALSRGLETALFGIISSDVRISLGFAAILITAALAAGYVPARRATKIDPIIALRAE